MTDAQSEFMSLHGDDAIDIDLTITLYLLENSQTVVLQFEVLVSSLSVPVVEATLLLSCSSLFEMSASSADTERRTRIPFRSCTTQSIYALRFQPDGTLSLSC